MPAKPGKDDEVFSALLLVRPYGHLISIRIGEVKAPAARKGKDRLDDGAARRANFGFHLCEIARVDDYQRTSAHNCILAHESARDAAVFEAGVIRPVVGELPSEDTCVEGLRARDIRRRELHIVDSSVVRSRLHGIFPRRQYGAWLLTALCQQSFERATLAACGAPTVCSKSCNTCAGGA